MRPNRIKNTTIYILFIFLFILYGENVYAAAVEHKVCLTDGTYYKVKWDNEVNTGVVSTNIDATAIQEGHVAYPTGVLDSDKYKYAITSELISLTCYIDSDQNIKTCESVLGTLSADKLLVKTNPETNLTESNIEYKYNINTGKYTIKIADPYGGKAKIRVIGTGTPNDGTKKASEYTLLSPSGGYFTLPNVSPSTINSENKVKNSEVGLEVYVNIPNSDCDGYYAGTATFVVNLPPEKLPNPAISNPNAYGCNNLQSRISQIKSYGYTHEEALEFAESFVDLCYSENVEYSKYYSLSTHISSQIAELDAFINEYIVSDSGTSNISTGNGFWCDSTRTGDKSWVKNGTYFRLTCKEHYEIIPDSAKLVRAGAGFKYTSIFKVTRTCEIKQKPITVTKKPQCHYGCSASCSYDTRAGRVEGQPSCGPNEDFDACINTCDNGNYTQECINSCYQKVYGDDRKLPTLTEKSSKNLSLLEEKYQVRKVSSQVVGTITTNDGCDGVMCTFPGCPSDFEVKFSNYCNEHNGVCTITEYRYPSGCVDNPEVVYHNELAGANNELTDFVNEIKDSTIKTGSYTIKIEDSYLKDSGNNAYMYEINDNGINKVVVLDDDVVSKNFTLGDSGSSSSGAPGSRTETSKTTYIKTITVDLANSYLNRKDSTVAYKIGSNKYAAFDVSPNSNTNKLKTLTFNTKLYYNGGKRYYTNVLSSNTNVVVPNDGGKVSLITYNDYRAIADVNRTAKIKVTVANLGTKSFGDSINCFYGVYNDTFCKDKDECPSDDDGIQFIFRPIDLDDVFPNEETSNRKPRWNWTNNASSIDPGTCREDDENCIIAKNKYNLLNYKIQPEALTTVIEKDGYSVYNDPNEIDYEIELTPTHITKIRDYNRKIREDENDYNKDGSYNYLDYDMSCFKHGEREVCYSKFLNNNGDDGYLKFLNISTVQRKDLAICNNSYEKKCVSDIQNRGR